MCVKLTKRIKAYCYLRIIGIRNGKRNTRWLVAWRCIPRSSHRRSLANHFPKRLSRRRLWNCAFLKYNSLYENCNITDCIIINVVKYCLSWPADEFSQCLCFRMCFVELQLLLIAVEGKRFGSSETYIAINPGPDVIVGRNTQGFFIAQSADEVKRWRELNLRDS